MLLSESSQNAELNANTTDKPLRRQASAHPIAFDCKVENRPGGDFSATVTAASRHSSRTVPAEQLALLWPDPIDCLR